MIALARADANRGERLARVRLGCVECHGDDFAGRTVVDEPMVARFFGANITPAGLKGWTGGELARAIRDGVSRDGRPLLLMPSQDFQHLSARDLADVVAFLRKLPAVDRPTRPSSLGPVMTALYALGKAPTITPVDVVDHEAALPPHPEEKVSPAFGRYIMESSCMGCHGARLQGGPITGGDPAWPPAAAITKDALGVYDEARFVAMLRSGAAPGGGKLRYPMITKYTKDYTDDELKAIWAYIQSLDSNVNF